MTGNDVTWPEVTGSDPEVMSFDRNSPGSGCTRPISQVLGTFQLLQGVTGSDWKSAGSDVIRMEVTWKWL